MNIKVAWNTGDEFNMRTPRWKRIAPMYSISPRYHCHVENFVGIDMRMSTGNLTNRQVFRFEGKDAPAMPAETGHREFDAALSYTGGQKSAR